MYDLQKLWKSASPGLRNLVALPFSPALSEDDRRLRIELWGPTPLLLLLLLAAGCFAAGVAMRQIEIDLPFDYWARIRWSIVLFAVAVAARVRWRIPLHQGDTAAGGFRAVFVPPLLAALALAVAEPLLLDAWSGQGLFAESLDLIGLQTGVLVMVDHTLANLTAAVVLTAVFAYSRSWGWATLGLAGAFFVFLLTVALTSFLILELAPLSRLTTLLADFVLRAVLSERLCALVDRYALIALLVAIYVAVLGSTWWHARERCRRLLAGDDVDLLSEMEAAMEDPEEGGS